MPCPEIAIHKIIVMGNPQQSRYGKRTQKDYTMSFKLQIVQEIEQGLTTISLVKKQYAIQSRSTIIFRATSFCCQ